MASMKNAIISLGAGNSQTIIINKALDMGYAVIGVDKNPEAPALYSCEEKLIMSTYDAYPIINQLKNISADYDFAGVICRSSGYPVVTAAKICQDFNLPGFSPAAAELSIHKSKLMDFCRTNNIPAPKGFSAKNIDELLSKNLVFPVVIRPSLSLRGKLELAKLIIVVN